MKTSRHIKKFLCCTYAAIHSLICLSQESISGKVINSATGENLSGVYVGILKEDIMLGSCYTDKNGVFNFTYSIGQKPEVIFAAMLGFSSFRQSISDSYIEIELKESSLNINAAVVSEKVIEVQGDTVSYSIGAFREKEDLVIADVLKRLPGIAVTESGGIIHNGNSINKFYIEGLDLLGGRYGIVTKNLSADDISHIEVYHNHQPIKVLSGITMTDRSAINIRLKESAKNSWILNGDLTLGGVKRLLFDSRTLLTRFSKRSQDLYLLKGCNSGKDIFIEIKEQEYFGKTGAFLITEGNIESDFQTTLNPRRTSLDLPKTYWYNNLSGVGSFNHLKAHDNELQSRISVQIAADKYLESSNNLEVINIDDIETICIDEKSSQRDKRYYINATTLLEKNSIKKFWSDELKISAQHRENTGISTGGTDNYTQNYLLPSIKIENKYNSVIRKTKNSTINIESLTTLVQNTHSANYSTNGVYANQSLNTFRIKNSNKTIFGFNIWQINFQATALLDFHHISQSSLLDCDFNTLTLTEKFNATEIRPGVGISTSIGKNASQLRLTVPSYIQIILAESNTFYPTFAPRLTYKLKLTQDLLLDANLLYQMSCSSVETLSKAAIMGDHRRIYTPMGQQKSNNATISTSLKYINNPAMLYASLTGDYIQRNSDKTSSNTYNEEYTLINYVYSPTKYSQYGLKGRISKHLGYKSFVIEVDAAWHQFSTKEYLQGNLLDFKGGQKDFDISMKTSALKWLNADVSLSYTINSMYGFTLSHLHNITSEASLSLKPCKSLIINGNIFHLWYSSLESLNMPLVTINSSWTFKRFSIFAECRNILNVSELRKEYTHPYRTIFTTSILRGREYLIGIRMSI